MLKSYCTLPFERLKIDADGSYQSCCYQSIKYGNIFTENKSIEEIFSSTVLREVKKSTLNKWLHPGCSNTTCPHYYSNLDRRYPVEITKYPIDIEISLHPTWCNIGGTKPTPNNTCIMCPRSAVGFLSGITYGDRTEEIVNFIKPAIPYLKRFSVLGISEPFYKGKIFKVLDQLNFKKYKQDIFFWTFSNGTVFNSKYQDLFINEYTDQSTLKFSLDAASPETYRKIRKADSYNAAIRNIERYSQKAYSQRNRRTWFETTYNINLLNLKEMEDMVRFSSNIGANNILFNTTYLAVENIKIPKHLLINKQNWQQFWEMQLKVEQLAKELDIKVEFFRPFHGGYINE